MKLPLALILILTYINGYSQTKLCEEKSVMYSICYKLEKDSTFTYNFNHCTGGVLGVGKYIKTKNNLKFIFDTLVSPQIRKQKIESNNGKVTITVNDITDRHPYPGLEVLYAGKVFMTDENGTVTIDYTVGPIKMNQYFEAQSIFINPQSEGANEYKIYWHSPGDTFMEKGKVIEMKKIGRKYKFREKVSHYNDRTALYDSFRWQTKYYVEK